MKKITFIRANTYYSDPRLIKISNCFEDFNRNFILWKRDRSDENIQNASYFSRLSPFGNTKKLLMNFPLWNIFCFRELKKTKPDIIHACDIEAVIPALYYSMFYRTKVVFDIWDATSGKITSGEGFTCNVANAIDRFCIRQSNHVFIPDYSRLEQINIENSSKISVVPNSNYIPNDHKSVDLSKKSEIILSYIGVMSRKIRGLEQIANISDGLPYCKFIIAGYGADADELSQKFKGHKNIDYVGKVTVEEAKEIYQKSDIVITILDPDYRNYRYATSTKVFDAFSNFKPVISTKKTASGDLVESAQWGVTINYNEKDLIEVIEKIKNGDIVFNLDYEKVKKYDWKFISKEINTLYQNL